MKYNGKEYNLKFDNLTLFKLAAAGVHSGDLLITKNSNPERFCLAHSIALGIEFNGDVKAYLDGFGKSADMFAVNAEVMEALERDGLFESDIEEAKKNANEQPQS